MSNVNDMIMNQRNVIAQGFTEFAKIVAEDKGDGSVMAAIDLVCRAMQDFATIAVCMNEIAAHKRNELDAANLQFAKLHKISDHLEELVLILKNKA